MLILARPQTHINGQPHQVARFAEPDGCDLHPRRHNVIHLAALRARSNDVEPPALQPRFYPNSIAAQEPAVHRARPSLAPARRRPPPRRSRLFSTANPTTPLSTRRLTRHASLRWNKDGAAEARATVRLQAALSHLANFVTAATVLAAKLPYSMSSHEGTPSFPNGRTHGRLSC